MPLEVQRQFVFSEVDTRSPAEMESQVQAIYLEMFPHGNPGFTSTAFALAKRCFEGEYPGYQAIDARYHDFEHTLQGTLCLARILQGRHRAGVAPVSDARRFELSILAILLHDTGYLKVVGDNEGTGAKYTLVHVHRSAEFAKKLLQGHGVPAADITEVQNMIRCTGVNVDLSGIPFGSELERLHGFALGSADLLGQMAARDYIDKLPILFSEFAESAAYNAGKMTAGGTFASADDLMRKTPLFWEKYVLPKLQRDFLGMYRFLALPYPDGPNCYVASIEANIDMLRRKMAEVAG